VPKTRVTPLKTQTIPRLELLSALLLPRLMKTVTESLQTRLTLQAPRCFTNSQIGLCWITGREKDCKPFVQNHVKEIRRLVPVGCWDHCSGKTNPTDIPSRVLSSKELRTNELWKHGPSWLHDDLDTPLLPPEIPEACAKELRSSDVVCLMGSTSNVVQLSSTIDCPRYSSVHKLYRITACVLKFVSLLKNRHQSCELTHNDLVTARKLWILDCQAMLVRETFLCGGHNSISTKMRMAPGDVRAGYRIPVYPLLPNIP